MLSLQIATIFFQIIQESGLNLVTNEDNVSLEMQSSITHASRCYFRLSRQLEGKVLSRQIVTKRYKRVDVDYIR